MRNIGKNKTSRLKEILYTHIKNNLKEYLIVLILFLIGLIFGIIFVNNASSSQINEIVTYINEFIENIKTDTKIDRVQLLQNTLISNLILTFIFWFMGSTVIGIPIVYGIVIYRGFCFGYTVSSIIASLGIGKGILFSLTALLAHNIILIPCILALAVSGIKLYSSIVKDKRRENIKLEITRHTIFSLILLFLLEISAFIEVYVSTNLLELCIRYC